MTRQTYTRKLRFRSAYLFEIVALWVALEEVDLLVVARLVNIVNRLFRGLISPRPDQGKHLLRVGCE